jgi:6,7-dimethyl-8-ribityllumazine synthase
VQGADKGNAGDLAGEGLRIGIVRARFNDAVTSTLAQACLAELERLEVDEGDIKHVSVPGALEVPVALKAMAASGAFDALIALGCVIRGETYHFELVANESGAGVSRVALDHQIPIANAILTVEDEDQAWTRAVDKGREAARAAVEMANLMEDLA